MKRNHLLSLLSSYNPTDDKEQAYKNVIIEFIQNNTNCFERTLEIGHITASSWLLNKEKTHALLMHHKKLDRWMQLGGHCDGESDVLAVSIKEAQEESGIQNISPVSSEIFDIDVHLIPANSKEKEHYHYDVRFLLYVTSDETFVQNEESHGLQWISKHSSQLPTNERSITRMFEKWHSL